MTHRTVAIHSNARLLRASLAALLVGAALAAPRDAAAGRFIPTFLVYYGGGPQLVAGDEAKLAKFDLIDTDRFRYNQIGANTWSAIKALNPAVQIYLYQIGPESQNYMDAQPAVTLNGLGRFNVSRGHSQGALNGNNPQLYLLDGGGQRIYSVPYSNVAQGTYWNLMDFGSSAYQQYWLEGVKADIIDQPWAADGIFADNCLTLSAAGSYSAGSPRYPSNAAWSAAMNNFVQNVSAGLNAYGQKLWCNRGETRTAEGSAAWLQLEASGGAPAIVMDEGAFAVEWGNGSTQFFPEDGWKRQLDTIGAIRNSKVTLMSHTKLMEGQSGTDNWGRPVSFGQTLWYALGSFLLAKNDNTYFMFNGGAGYNRIWWFDEYERIDLGAALGGYRVSTVGGVNVYWREFEKGYVYVNPSATDVAAIALPQASRLLTRATLASVIDALPIVTAIPLPGHHASIVMKTLETPAGDTQAPTVPTGLSASAVSGTQVNLAWNASTDNVGVTGYYVYLNDAPLATTTGTSYSHTGLTVGTTYNYRVSAYDAVPNHSAWSAAPVAVTTPASTPVADTQAPTVPAGLSATAVSGTQVNLAWNASTDNVGVTGYYVYLNDQLLGATTARSYSHTGLTPGATYSYRVSAYDAVPNHSAWSAAPVAVTTPASTPVADTQAPTVPAGLTASAVSGTQVNLAWNASSDNVGVTGYHVYLNDQPLGTTTARSYSHTGLTPGATYSYRVSAYDAVPNHSAWSAAPVAVTTPAPTPVADTQAPVVSLSSPKAGATVSRTVALSANATDNVGVAGVQFQYNGVNLNGEVTSAPFTTVARLPRGKVALTAIARDAAGNRTTSAPIVVRVW